MDGDRDGGVSPSAVVVGLTVQVELAGAPVQVKAAVQRDVGGGAEEQGEDCVLAA